MLIDVAISGDRIMIKKEAEKILKCKDLTIEIQRIIIIIIIITIITAIGLLPGGSGYFTCKQTRNWLLLNLSREGYMRSM